MMEPVQFLLFILLLKAPFGIYSWVLLVPLVHHDPTDL